jgi:hypothetical protein
MKKMEERKKSLRPFSPLFPPSSSPSFSLRPSRFFFSRWQRQSSS